MIDRKLAKGYVRQGMRSLTRSIDDARQEIGAAMVEEARRYFWKSRRITGGALQDLAERLDALAMDGLVPVRRRAIYRPPTAARPKSDAYEMAYVSAFPFEKNDPGAACKDRYFDVRGTRILVTRKKVEVTSTWLGASFHEHTARRTLERDGVDKGENPINAIAGAVSSNAAMICLTLRRMTPRPNARFAVPPSQPFAVPFSNGLLLGNAVATPGPRAGTVMTFNMYGYHLENLDEQKSLDATTGFSNVEVATFVNMAQMFDGQQELCENLGEWTKKHADAVSALNDSLAWPGATLIEDGVAEWAPENVTALLANAERDMARILKRAERTNAFGHRLRFGPSVRPYREGEAVEFPGLGLGGSGP